MKKTTWKKLAVSRTTIRNLTGPQMARAAGGQTLATCTEECTDPALCADTADPHFCNLDTQFIHGCHG